MIKTSYFLTFFFTSDLFWSNVVQRPLMLTKTFKKMAGKIKWHYSCYVVTLLLTSLACNQIFNETINQSSCIDRHAGQVEDTTTGEAEAAADFDL